MTPRSPKKPRKKPRRIYVAMGRLWAHSRWHSSRAAAERQAKEDHRLGGTDVRVLTFEEVQRGK